MGRIYSLEEIIMKYTATIQKIEQNGNYVFVTCLVWDDTSTSSILITIPVPQDEYIKSDGSLMLGKKITVVYDSSSQKQLIISLVY